MSNGLKLVLYVALSICTMVFGALAYGSIKQSIDARNAKASRLLDQASDTGSGERPADPQAVVNPSALTNELAVATNAPATNDGLAIVNQVLNATNVSAALTNLQAAITTNQVATNEEVFQTAPVPKSLSKAAKEKLTKKKKMLRDAQGNEIVAPPEHMGLFIGLLLVSALGLGTLTAFDISHFMGNRALKVIYNDDLEGMKDPEYEEAEAEWANGKHLEAVRLMREYLKKNPREQHVALRIAEIYEKDLNNYLAAALEYEEVLKQKLPAERWGWAAIHLCNLYFKLGHEDKAVALLQKIDAEYGQTAAADKARKRLEQMNIPTSLDESAAQAQMEEAKAPAEEKGPKLPPGFTLKKR